VSWLLYAKERAQVPIGEEAEWAQGCSGWMWRREKISFPSLDFELQTVQPVGSYYTDFCCSIVVDIFASLGNFKTLKSCFFWYR